MAAVSAPPAPVLEAATKQRAEATSPHPRIYEMSPDQGRAPSRPTAADQDVAKPEVDEERVSVDLDSLRDAHGTRAARHLAIDALKTALNTEETPSAQSGELCAMKGENDGFR